MTSSSAHPPQASMRWQPATYQELETAVTEGSFHETHWAEAKAYDLASQSNRKDLAKALASFANDGGAVFLGVGEEKTNSAFFMSPMDLEGAKERIDGITTELCDPPLFVIPRELPIDGEPNKGAMLIEVPPSANAPHQADNRYWVRRGSSKVPMVDAEVQRWHEARRSRHVASEDLIRREVDRDVVQEFPRKPVRLYIVARPIASASNMATDALSTDRAAELVRGAGRASEAGWKSLHSEPRPHGHGWFRDDSFSGRKLNPAITEPKRTWQYIEVFDNGTITVLALACSKALPDSDEHLVFDDEIARITEAVVTLAGNLGAEHHYGGLWHLAVGLLNLNGRASSRTYGQLLGGDPVRFGEADYIEGTEAVTAEMLERVDEVKHRLLYRFIRGLGVANCYGW